MDYKKIFRSRKLRFTILVLLSWIPDNIMLRIQYRIKMGFWPNFKTPKRYTEKIQLYKMNYRNSVMPKCVDKYDVRNYVKQKGFSYILNQLYGVYEKIEDIDFNSLPEEFVAKSTIGGGGLDVVIVKKNINQEELYKKFEEWLQPRKNMDTGGREWAYTVIKKPRIVIEKLLKDTSNKDGSIDDYKFMCFNGKFACMWVDKDRYTAHKRGFWDKDLNYLPHVSSEYPPLDKPYMLPSNIKEMVSIAEKLSEDFPHARIDLYNVKGKIIFGEITFYFSSGYADFTPDSFDFELGECFDNQYLK